MAEDTDQDKASLYRLIQRAAQAIQLEVDEEFDKLDDVDAGGSVRRRQAADIVVARLKKFATDNSIAIGKKTVTQSQLARKVDGQLNLKPDLAKLIAKYLSAKSEFSSIGLSAYEALAMPYNDSEMQSLKQGTWCLIKRSHTIPGEVSLSHVLIKHDKEEFKDSGGYIWRYQVTKNTEESKNLVEGLISRNHGQYLFVGAEKYIYESGPDYPGTQIISVKMDRSANKLYGVTINATHGHKIPCATSTTLVYCEKFGVDDSGVYPEEKCKRILEESGLSVSDIPSNCTDNLWKMILAEA